ncbi:hypothetical protein NC652_033314 [Populus alba x Populus x berolinensis]|nr:hypothetical protein NC652_033314 [Populus alba x Populus x berolinensis]
MSTACSTPYSSTATKLSPECPHQPPARLLMECPACPTTTDTISGLCPRLRPPGGYGNNPVPYAIPFDNNTPLPSFSFKSRSFEAAVRLFSAWNSEERKFHLTKQQALGTANLKEENFGLSAWQSILVV